MHLADPNAAGDCPDFAQSAQQNGTVPFSQAVLGSAGAGCSVESGRATGLARHDAGAGVAGLPPWPRPSQRHQHRADRRRRNGLGIVLPARSKGRLHRQQHPQIHRGNPGAGQNQFRFPDGRAPFQRSQPDRCPHDQRRNSAGRRAALLRHHRDEPGDGHRPRNRRRPRADPGNHERRQNPQLDCRLGHRNQRVSWRRAIARAHSDARGRNPRAEAAGPLLQAGGGGRRPVDRPRPRTDQTPRGDGQPAAHRLSFKTSRIERDRDSQRRLDRRGRPNHQDAVSRHRPGDLSHHARASARGPQGNGIRPAVGNRRQNRPPLAAGRPDAPGGLSGRARRRRSFGPVPRNSAAARQKARSEHRRDHRHHPALRGNARRHPAAAWPERPRQRSAHGRRFGPQQHDRERRSDDRHPGRRRRGEADDPLAVARRWKPMCTTR